MGIKLIYFITLLLYSAVISQSFFYILAMTRVSRSMQAQSYIEARQLLDKNLRSRLSLLYYVTLLAGILLVAFTVTNPHGFLFFSAVFALMALIADIILILKGNIPLNKTINSWSPSRYPENWSEYRAKWLATYRIRQVINLSGFVVLVAGFVFGQ